MNLVSVIIPIYNKASEIEHNFLKLKSFLDEHVWNYEIILVDDGSTDNTSKILQNFVHPKQVQLLTLKANYGKGFAVKSGFELGRGDYLIFIDSDLPYELKAISLILKELNNSHQVVIGSRKLSDSKSKMKVSFLRRIGSDLFSQLTNLLVIKGIYDTQCGIKGFSKSAAKSIFPKVQIDGFCFDVEVLYYAQEQNMNIAQIPVTLLNNSHTSLNIFNVSKMFKDLIGLWYSTI